MAKTSVTEKPLSRGTTRRQLVQSIPAATAGLAATALAAETALAEDPAPVKTSHKEPPKQDPIERTLPKPSFDYTEIESSAWEIYECQDSLDRFSSRNTAFKRVSEDLAASWPVALLHNGLAYMDEAKIGHGVPVSDRMEARADIAFMVGCYVWNGITERYGEGLENMGLLSWNPLYVPEWLSGNPEPGPDPQDLTKKFKAMARIFGAGRAGIAEINRKWVLSETARNMYSPEEAVTKPIVFKDVDRPAETDAELVIPEKVKYAIVIVTPVSWPATRIGPSSFFTQGVTADAYGRHGLTEIALAEAIRAMGYVAIPCKNSTALSVPLAIDAGLGQLGRLGYLITPWYGPHVRLGKVLTDMPLVPDKPIDFGVTDYCTQCGLCATECPAGAISMSRERGYKPPKLTGPTGNPGAKKWYLDGKKCLNWWVESGNPCALCMTVCPYTRFSLTDFWNGEDPDPNAFWDLELPRHGIEDKLIKES